MKRAEGIDIAVINQVSYDHAASKRKHSFICIRAVEGTKIDQTRWGFIPKRTYYDLLPQIEPVKLRGAYIRTVPSRKTGKTWQQQSETMIGAVNDAGKDFFHFIWIDLEPTKGMPLTVEWVKESWLIRRELEETLGIPAYFYINTAVWFFCWQYSDLRWMAQETLAIAQYPYRYWNPIVLDFQYDPVKWQPRLDKRHYDEGGSWIWWQCSANENAAVKFARDNGIMNPLASKAVDWDLFNGTEEKMYEMFGIKAVEPKPEPPKPPLPIEIGVSRVEVAGLMDEMQDIVRRGKKLVE